MTPGWRTDVGATAEAGWPERKLRLLPDRNWAQSRSALGQPVVCGPLTLCGKDFTTGVCVIWRTVEAGSSETRKGLSRKMQQDRA